MNPILKYDKEIVGGKDNNSGGFYYDIHRRNILTKISLHANAVPPKSIYSDWPSWSTSAASWDPDFIKLTDPEGDPWRFGLEEVFPEPEGEEVTDGYNICYGRQSLCNSVLAEDFGITIANNWGDFSAGQGLENIFNQGKAYEPYLNTAADLFNRMTAGIENYKNEISNQGKDTNKSSLNILGKVTKGLASTSKKGANIFRRALVVQGTRFKYYSGTGIAFSNLGMKFTLFPDYFNGKFKTVDDQLAALRPYSVGKFVNFLDDKDDVMKKASDEILDKIGVEENTTKEDIKKAANRFLGWQIPPGGFKASVEYIDHIQVGTLMLKLGPYYCLKNLVIQEIQLNYSKYVTKYFDTNTNKIKTCPMYCDVMITFMPATKYSDKKLKEFVLSQESEGIKDLENNIHSRLFNDI